jgi:CRISPR-associated endoribonuclease Cas6
VAIKQKVKAYNMRILLTLQCAPNSALPINNRHELCAILYRIIEKSSPEFSEWLHNHGYTSGGRFFKLFTFGNLTPLPYRIDYDAMIATSGKVEWEVSFYVDEIIEKFVGGIFQAQNFGLGNEHFRAVDCNITGVNIVETPDFQPTMRYRTSSPILIGQKQGHQKHETYLSPLDTDFEQVFLHNLRGKVDAIAPEWSNAEASFRLISKPDQVKIKGFKVFKKGIPPMQYKPFQFDFELTAPVSWQKIGYLAGFGQDNAMGLGMCKVL